MIQRYRSSRIGQFFIHSPSAYLGFATLLVVLSNISFGTVPFFAKNLTDAGIAPARNRFLSVCFNIDHPFSVFAI